MVINHSYFVGKDNITWWHLSLSKSRRTPAFLFFLEKTGAASPTWGAAPLRLWFSIFFLFIWRPDRHKQHQKPIVVFPTDCWGIRPFSSFSFYSIRFGFLNFPSIGLAISFYRHRLQMISCLSENRYSFLWFQIGTDRTLANGSLPLLETYCFRPFFPANEA